MCIRDRHKDKDWKIEMRNIEVNKLGLDGWEMVGMNDNNEMYFKRKI